MKPIKLLLRSTLVILLAGTFAQCAQTTLHVFNVNDGQYPQATLTPDADGNFYGSTSYGGANGQGTIFKMTPIGVFIPVSSVFGKLTRPRRMNYQKKTLREKNLDERGLACNGEIFMDGSRTFRQARHLP